MSPSRSTLLKVDERWLDASSTFMPSSVIFVCVLYISLLLYFDFFLFQNKRREMKVALKREMLL